MNLRNNHLGELGCTRDGYVLIAAGMLLYYLSVLAVVASLGMQGLMEYEQVPLWMVVIVLPGPSLVTIGLAAQSRYPHGPFPRWAKRVVVAFALVLTLTLVLGDREGFPEVLAELILTRTDFVLAAVCLGSLAFSRKHALRRSLILWSLALACWGLWRAIPTESGPMLAFGVLVPASAAASVFDLNRWIGGARESTTVNG